MNTIAARIAHADQTAAALRDARTYDGHAASCDALDPCHTCKTGKLEVAYTRHDLRRHALTH